MSRRFTDPRTAAEAAFKAATAKPARTREASALPGAKESVSLRVDSDVLEFFQAEGPGWQERMVAVLRAAAGK